MLTVGLTGGIGSGKSAVGARLAALGAVVVDADAIAREIVEPGRPALAEVVARFGPGMLDEHGRLRRQALADVVFADPDALADLETITHPRIAARAQALVDAAPEDAVVVYDMPLLVEQGLAPGYDVVVVVDCPEAVRLARLVHQRGMSEADALARMAAQTSREERLAVADFVVNNEGSASERDHQVDALWAQLVAAAEG